MKRDQLFERIMFAFFVGVYIVRADFIYLYIANMFLLLAIYHKIPSK